MAYYRSCLAQAFLALERYPRLLLLHLDLNYPVYRWNEKRVETILDGRERGWVEEGMLISSWQTAGPALDVSILLIGQEIGILGSLGVGNSCSERRCYRGEYCARRLITCFI